MTTEVILSFVGCLLGIGVLIFCAYKSVNIYLYTLLASAIVLVFSGQGIWSSFSGVYMPGFASYFYPYFLLFTISTLFSFMLSESGATTVIAVKILKLVDKAKTPVGGAFAAVTALGVVQAIFVIGGISPLVSVFLLTGLARDLFKKMDIPWHLAYLSCWGGSSTVACFLPGLAQSNNILPQQYFNSPTWSLPGISFIVFAFAMVLTLIYSYRVIKRVIGTGEKFFPTGAVMDARYPKDERQKEWDQKQPMSLFIALVPLAIVLIVMNLGISASLSMLIGCVSIMILHFKTYKPKQFLGSVEKSFPTGIMVLANVCAVVGFGAVVSNTPAYQYLLSGLSNIISGSNGSSAATLWIMVGAISIACGFTATATGGLQIVLNQLSGTLLATGWNVQVLHRLSVMTTGVFDSLPHSAAIINGFQVFGVNHKMVYKYVFVETVVITGIATILATFLCSLGWVF